MKIREPEMFRLAEEGENNKIGKIIFNFFIIFIISLILSSIPQIVVLVVETINAINNGIPLEELEAQLENSRAGMYAMLFSTIITSLIVIWYCKKKEKISLRAMGFERKNAIRNYLFGLIIGFAMFSSVIGINVATGAMTMEGLTTNFSISTVGFILLFLLGFLFQGAEEEILTRGYLMVSIGAKHNMRKALLISSIIFALLHAFNPGLTILALINLTLFGVFAGLYIICFDNIWGACAIHSIWNFAQGNFYGISVSGMAKMDSIFSTVNTEGKELINGGAFGAEGGIATTISLVVAIVLLFVYMKKTGRIERS